MTAPTATATGEKQTIQARHGVATFVPKGHTIKIINTYGKQVVDTWAFALHAPPEDEEIYKEGEEEEGKKAEESKKEKLPASDGPSKVSQKTKETAKEATDEAAKEGQKVTEKTSDIAESAEEASGEAAGEAKMATEKVTEKVDVSAKKAGWSAYLPSVRRGTPKVPEVKETKGAEVKDEGENEEVPENMTKSWSSYLPSMTSKKPADSDNTNSQSKGWSSYIPSGVGFSSYMPPKGSLSGFAASHARDPTKSYAEQLFDFSKTPVGAAGLSGLAAAATGSGYAGSLYAAYKAYDQIASNTSIPGMEYLSMMHTRASTLHLSPRVNDTLVSNLRAPLLTLVEDTSPGIHDTLIAACDPQRYRELGADEWETHGSCSENLVLALNEINERIGLKGSKAIGRDVTVNSVPAPLNLFMNIPWTQDGEVSFDAPKGKRGDYVKFRAERDLVVVMSACPQDLLDINGRKPMVAHFVVESPSPEDAKKAKERDEEAQRVLEKAKLRQAKAKTSAAPKTTSTEKSNQVVPAPRRDSAASAPAPKRPEPPSSTPSQTSEAGRNAPKPGRKAPKKLEKRGSVTATS